MHKPKNRPRWAERTVMPYTKGNLSEAARQARNAAAKVWRAKNKDKVREYNRRYWEKKAKEAQHDGEAL